MELPAKAAGPLEQLLARLVFDGDYEICSRAWSALILGWSHFCTTHELQVKWMRTILECSKVLNIAPALSRKDSFLYSLKVGSSPILYNSQMFA